MARNKTFYTYLWLREDGTPYYVGKGSGYRAWSLAGRSVAKPKDKSRIILQAYDTEDESLEAERILIAFYGRKDIGSGILHNHTDGGDAGWHHGEEARQKITNSKKGRKRQPFSAEWLANMSAASRGKPKSKSHREKLKLANMKNGPKRRGIKQRPEVVALHRAQLLASKEWQDNLRLGNINMSLESRQRQKAGAEKAWAARRAITHCPRGHEYTPENTYIQSKTNGKTHRSCWECRRIVNARAKRPPRIKTSCKYGHPWVKENIYTNKRGSRSCLNCRRIRSGSEYRKNTKNFFPKTGAA